jgi:hypothetical protein
MGASYPWLVVVVAAVLLWWVWPTKPTMGAQLVQEIDVGPDWTGVVSTKYQRELAYRFKAAYGELRYNNANLNIASDFCRKAMREEDVRFVDQVSILPVAVQLCLLPTIHALRATQLANTPEVRARRAAVECSK